MENWLTIDGHIDIHLLCKFIMNAVKNCDNLEILQELLSKNDIGCYSNNHWLFQMINDNIVKMYTGKIGYYDDRRYFSLSNIIYVYEKQLFGYKIDMNKIFDIQNLNHEKIKYMLDCWRYRFHLDLEKTVSLARFIISCKKLQYPKSEIIEALNISEDYYNLVDDDYYNFMSCKNEHEMFLMYKNVKTELEKYTIFIETMKASAEDLNVDEVTISIACIASLRSLS